MRAVIVGGCVPASVVVWGVRGADRQTPVRDASAVSEALARYGNEVPERLVVGVDAIARDVPLVSSENSASMTSSASFRPLRKPAASPSLIVRVSGSRTSAMPAISESACRSGRRSRRGRCRWRQGREDVVPVERSVVGRPEAVGRFLLGVGVVEHRVDRRAAHPLDLRIPLPAWRATVVAQTPTVVPVPPMRAFGHLDGDGADVGPGERVRGGEATEQRRGSVVPVSSCFLNSTKPGRSKKNGSSRGPAKALPPPDDGCDARGCGRTAVVLPVATTDPVQASALAAAPVARLTM